MATPQQSVGRYSKPHWSCAPKTGSPFSIRSAARTADLKRMVEKLLLENERAGSFLEKPLFHFKKNEEDTG